MINNLGLRFDCFLWDLGFFLYLWNQIYAFITNQTVNEGRTEVWMYLLGFVLAFLPQIWISEAQCICRF